MTKQLFTNTMLSCTLQENSIITPNKCLHGILSQTSQGFRFEEEAKSGTHHHTRNPKIYDGSYVSMVRKEDNSIQFAFKTTKADLDPEKFPSEVYQEVSNALKMIV